MLQFEALSLYVEGNTLETLTVLGLNLPNKIGSVGKKNFFSEPELEVAFCLYVVVIRKLNLGLLPPGDTLR